MTAGGVRSLSVGLAAILAMGIVGCGSDEDGVGQEVDPRRLVLSLDDLPTGYVVADDAGCGGLGVEGASTELADLVIEYMPRGCATPFETGYPADEQAGNPREIQSMAYVFPSTEGAEAALDVAPDLLDWETGLDPTALSEAEPVRNLGDDTRAFRSPGDQFNPASSIVVWRDGSLLGAVLAGGVQGANVDEVASEYAAKQQGHFESPPTEKPSSEPDPALLLDDPDQRVDVYWLGSTFDPGGGLPPLELADVYGPIGRGAGPPGDQLKIDYVPGVTLDTWTRKGWARFSKSRLGRLVVDSPCTSSRTLKLPRGHAVIYAGYAELANGCPSRPPGLFLAHVFLGDVVVAVNIPICFNCVGRAGAWDSMEGMIAVARGLRPR